MKFSGTFIRATDEMCDFDRHVAAPYLRKTFSLDLEPRKAEITICGLRFYELTVNGKNITKGPLAPYISNPDDVCYYDRYDLTGLLKKGPNAIGILLGNGFRNSFGGFIWDFDKASCRGVPAAALCLEATDGEKTFEMEADETFRVHPSPVLFDEERMGCRYDARLEIPGWDLADYVLGSLKGNDGKRMEEAFRTAADAAELLVTEGGPAAMNRYNTKPQKPAKKERPVKKEESGEKEGSGEKEQES